LGMRSNFTLRAEPLLAGNTIVLLCCGGPPFPRRTNSPFLRWSGHQAHRLIRDFAPPPHGGFALVGKGSPRYKNLLATQGVCRRERARRRRLVSSRKPREADRDHSALSIATDVSSVIVSTGVRGHCHGIDAGDYTPINRRTGVSTVTVSTDTAHTGDTVTPLFRRAIRAISSDFPRFRWLTCFAQDACQCGTPPAWRGRGKQDPSTAEFSLSEKAG
jgi:hypothetical protein